jgi:hypothetical protein
MSVRGTPGLRPTLSLRHLIHQQSAQWTLWVLESARVRKTYLYIEVITYVCRLRKTTPEGVVEILMASTATYSL